MPTPPTRPGWRRSQPTPPGASLLGKAARAGGPTYLKAAHLFVAEEQEHAQLLRRLLASAGQPILTAHWSDRVFVVVRRALGLRLELMTLMLAEVVALRYYRAVRDGTGDRLLTGVGGRILADEERHVQFHCQRLRHGFDEVPRLGRVLAAACWWMLLLGAAVVVAVDHGAALRHLDVRRTRFVRDVAGLCRGVVAEVFGRRLPPLVAGRPVCTAMISAPIDTRGPCQGDLSPSLGRR